MTVLYFIAGLICLIVGAEALVRGASRLASAFGISPLIIGLTVVAFGTSSPELAVSIKAGLDGQGAIAMGNVVGSNIFNVLFILGLASLVAPLVVSQQLIRLDVPLMILLSALVLVMGLDGAIGRVDGAILVIALAGYLIFLLKKSKTEPDAIEKEYEEAFGKKPSSRALNFVMIAVGLGLLVLGSKWLVDGAVSFAIFMGVSEAVVALTIVAAGTSLPEVVTSVIATIRGERDIAVGNVVGSNIFNIMGVLGVTGLITPGGIDVPDAMLRFDIPIMIGVAFACLPIFFTGGLISRMEGTALLGFYVAYTAFLVMASTQHDALPAFSAAMLYFVVPLTALTLFIVFWREVRGSRPPAP